MVNRMWLFGIILAIPLMGLAVSEGIQAYFNHELRSALRERFPNMDSRELSQLTIDRICDDPPPGFQDLCSTNRNLNLMSAGALLAGALGIALLIVIRVAGFASRTNRLLLLYLFKPGLYFLECFSVAESRISRSRELSADKEGGIVTNSTAMASALVKVHAFSGLWEELKKVAVDELQKGNYFVNASKTYAEAASKIATPNVFEGIAETHLKHPTDTHPPLSERLDGLGITIEDVSKQALEVMPNEPAIGLLEDPTQIEEDISGAYQGILARQLGIDLEHEETAQENSNRRSDSSPKGDHMKDKADFKKRNSCSDGNCIGVINEAGVCNICGKLYTGEPV